MCVCERVNGQAGLDREARVPCVQAQEETNKPQAMDIFFHIFSTVK